MVFETAFIFKSTLPNPQTCYLYCPLSNPFSWVSLTLPSSHVPHRLILELGKKNKKRSFLINFFVNKDLWAVPLKFQTPSFTRGLRVKHLMTVNLKDIEWLSSDPLSHSISELLNPLSSCKFSCKPIHHSVMSMAFTMLSYTCSLYCNQSVT